MINILTSSFNLFDLLAVLLMLLPVILAVIMSKTFNVVHGIITFFLVTYLFMYLFEFDFFNTLMFDTLADKSSFFADLSGLLGAGLSIFHFLATPVTYLLSLLTDVEALNEILTGSMGHHILLGGLVLLFVLSQVVGSVLRKNR